MTRIICVSVRSHPVPGNVRRFVRKSKRNVALYLSAQTGMGPTGITTRKRGFVVRKTKKRTLDSFFFKMKSMPFLRTAYAQRTSTDRLLRDARHHPLLLIMYAASYEQ
jgi:hypothetical protein